MAAATEEQPQTVRFSDVNEEIEPEEALQHVSTLTGAGQGEREPLSPEAAQELKNLSMSLQKSRCQAHRLANFSYEPCSLPPSRAPSPSPASRTASGLSSRRHSGIHNSALHSPPLTPAGSSSREGKLAVDAEHRNDPAMVTPQISPPHEAPPTSIDSIQSSERRPTPAHVSQSPRASPQLSPRPGTPGEIPGFLRTQPKNPVVNAIGPTGDSIPPSRDESPSASTGADTPGRQSPGASTPNKRPSPAIDGRFAVGGQGQSSPNTSTAALPRSKANADKRSSFFGGMVKHNDRHGSADESDAKSAVGKANNQHHSSMSELKRFFKIGGHKHKDKDKETRKAKRAASPAPSAREKAKASRSGTSTPPQSRGSIAVPFADDHGLEGKYGKFGRVLGSGAGGSVRLMKRSSDGVTFAVKQFRARHSYESERDYNKKVTAEFCIGSTLHHGNIIETMDLVNEKSAYFVVMEYAPFDLFAIVMTGKMSREEVACCTLQIVTGVNYIHSMGLAHRDLKLDNVVVNEHGIMKIIDFGSAAVFRYPFENGLVLASGIVGSDPYLAPEVYDLSKYDPQPTDVWSLAIIFCCMTLRRFPWKAPRVSDNSYKLFIAPPNDGPKSIMQASRSATDLDPDAPNGHGRKTGAQSEPTSRMPSDQTTSSHHHHNHRDGVHSDPPTHDDRRGSTNTDAGNGQPPQVIKGPWRLLRLLPRESRHIMGRMLELDPSKRATLQDILEDKWVQGAQICSQEEGGKICLRDNHKHTLEPGSGSSTAANTAAK